MQRSIPILLSVFLLAACSLPNAASPQPAQSGCGDKVCDGPETAQTCPADCAQPVTPPTVESAPQLLTQPEAQPLNRPVNLQIGLNFIRFYWSDAPGVLDMQTPYLQPPAMFDDMKALGVHSYRQFVKADLYWDVVEPQDNQWNFAQADAVIPNAEFEPIVGLFRMQYTSPTPPWASDPSQFQKTMGVEAEDYLKTVVQRYAPYVKYWEIGNEMAFWRAADPATGQANIGGHGEEALPAAYPLEGYSPQEQGVFLAQAAALIRQYDPDAVIVMPGLPGLSGYAVDTWLPGVLETAGADWFDIFNYHDYSDWEIFTLQRPRLTEALKKLGIGDKPVWNTETGSSSSAALTIRTDYPNSAETQAADVFRRIVQAWGHGDSHVVWHTYITNSDTGGSWAAYGLKTQNGSPQPSYYAFKLLTSELIPFAQVELLSSDGRGVNAYKVITQAGAVKYVAWGRGNYSLPDGATQFTSVIPTADGSFSWQAAQAGQSIPLTEYPILIK